MAKYNMVQLVFDREALSPDEDVAVMTGHIREVVSGAPDILPVTDQGRANYVQNVNDWWSVVRQIVTPNVVLREARFYNVPDQPGVDMGDPVLVHAYGQPGTSSSPPLPPQIALSVTLKTDQRKTWGRQYLPGITEALTDAKGRVDTTQLLPIAQAWQQLTSRASTGAALIVFSRKQWTHHDPQQIQIDDILDVVRRRRFSSTNYREIVSAG